MDGLQNSKRDPRLSYYQQDLVQIITHYNEHGWIEKPDASNPLPSLTKPTLDSVKGDSNLPPTYEEATATLDSAAALWENADRLRRFLIYYLSVEYSATSVAELSSEDKRFFMRLSQHIVWHERDPASSFTSLDHFNLALEHESLINALVSDPARHLGVPIEPAKRMIECYILCLDTKGFFQSRWNSDFQPSLDEAARKLFLDRDSMIDAVLRNHDNPQLRKELHTNLARIQAKYFVSLMSAVDYVPTQLGEHLNMLRLKFSSERDFLNHSIERVGLLRYLDTIKTDRTCRRFLKTLLRDMDDEDDAAEEKRMGPIGWFHR